MTPDTPPPIIAQGDAPAANPADDWTEGRVVIDLLPLAPLAQECVREEPDPFNPEIVVCRETGPSPRIGPDMLPEVDDFGNAIPRAQLKLSDKASAEANVINQSVGGFNANGGEVRLKIDF